MAATLCRRSSIGTRHVLDSRRPSTGAAEVRLGCGTASSAGMTWTRRDRCCSSNTTATDVGKPRRCSIRPRRANRRVLFDRSTDDAYGDPGTPVLTAIPDGRRLTRGRHRLYLRGEGATPAGMRPFFDLFDLARARVGPAARKPAGAVEHVVGFTGRAAARWCSCARARPSHRTWWWPAGGTASGGR